MRLTIAQTALGQISDIAHQVKTAAMSSEFVPDANGQTTEQRVAGDKLDLLVGLLNTSVGDRYLFSGKSFDQLPVESPAHILDGDGARAGLKQMISERRQADLGASGLGRLLIPASVGATLSIGEDVAGSPFGLKLASATSTLTGATVTGPAGAPPSVSIDLGATNPTAGDSIKLSFTLPDGTSTDLTLTATNANPPGPNAFTIGANDVTAANHSGADHGRQRIAGSTLAAASAVAAGDFIFQRRREQSAPAGRRPAVRSAPRSSPGPPPTVRLVHRRGRHRPARSTACAHRHLDHRLLRHAGE